MMYCEAELAVCPWPPIVIICGPAFGDSLIGRDRAIVLPSDISAVAEGARE